MAIWFSRIIPQPQAVSISDPDHRLHGVVGVAKAMKGSFRTDLRQVTPVIGAITVLPVVVVFAAGLGLDNVRAAIAMAIGANLVAIVSLVSAPKIPVSLATADAVGMAVSVFVGSATASNVPLHLAFLVVWCFASGMLVVFGLTQATVGTQNVIAFVVLGRFVATPADAVVLGLFVLVGALVEVGALLLLRLPPTLRAQRWGLAAAIDALVDQTGRPPDASTADVVITLDAAERLFDAPALFARSDVQTLRAVLDQARRARLELTTLAGLRARRQPHVNEEFDRALDATLSSVATALSLVALGLRRPRADVDLVGAVARVDVATGELRHAVGRDTDDVILDQQCLARCVAVGGQLRAMRARLDDARTPGSWRLARTRAARPATSQRDKRRRSWDMLSDNFTLASPIFRHAIRMTVAVPLSLLIARVAGMPRSYWVPFAVVTILKPDYGTLVSRGVGRVVGTLLGATLAAVLVSTLHPGEGLTVVLVALTGWLAYATWQASFPTAIGFVTSMVLIILSTSLHDSIGTAVDRFVDIALGGAIALVAYVLWPSPARPGVEAALANMFEALGHYVAATLDRVQGGDVSDEELARLSRSARLAWDRAQTSVGAAVVEPSSDASAVFTDRGLVVVGLRLVRATHALRLESAAGSSLVSGDATRDFCRNMVDGLGQLTQGVTGVPVVIPDLRSAMDRATAENGEGANGSSFFVHADELVNALNTAAFLMTEQNSASTTRQ